MHAHPVGISSSPPKSSKWPGWTSFEIAFTDPAMWRSLLTTLKFAPVGGSAEMFLGIARPLALEGNIRVLEVIYA